MVHILVSSQLVLSVVQYLLAGFRGSLLCRTFFTGIHLDQMNAMVMNCVLSWTAVHCAVVAPPLVHQGSLLTLQGAGAYDAAVHCASVSAARRILSQRGDTPTHAAGAPLRPFDQLLPYTPRGVSHCFHSHTLTAPALLSRELCASLQCSAMRRDL